jgi:uncharacterized membrane protein YdjX (TVP38/TMEM64 family)
VLGGDPWDPLTLRAWASQAGSWGPAIYVAVATLMPLFAPYPVGLAWVAGALFGWSLGGTLVAVSGIGSAFVGYGAGRFLGGCLWGAGLPAAVRGRLPRQSAGWRTVAFLRVVVPWDFVSYWAGALRLPLRAYLAGTLAALLPVSFGYTYVASAFVEGHGWRIAVAVPLLLGALFGPLWYAERQSRCGTGHA